MPEASSQHSISLLERAKRRAATFRSQTISGNFAHADRGDAALLESLVEQYEDLEEKSERQATNVGALYRQRRDADLACELSRDENKRLLEQLETLTQERDTWKVEAEYWSGQARNRAFRNAQEEVGRMVAQRDDLVEQLEAANEYANEGWAWLGAALHALGVTHVFEIPDWQENLRKSNTEMAAKKAVAGSYPASNRLLRPAVMGTTPVEASNQESDREGE